MIRKETAATAAVAAPCLGQATRSPMAPSRVVVPLVGLLWPVLAIDSHNPYWVCDMTPPLSTQRVLMAKYDLVINSIKWQSSLA